MAFAFKTSAPLAIAKRNARLPARTPVRKLVVRASAEPAPSSSTEEYVQKAQAMATEAWATVKAKWDATDDTEKPAAVAIVVGVVVAQIAIGATIDVVDRIPLVNKLLQLVGIFATAFYIYKYSTNPEERDIAKQTISGFLSKVTGDK